MPIFHVPDESLEFFHLVLLLTLLWLQHLTCHGLFLLLWANCCWCPNVTSRQWILLIDLLSSTWWMVVHKSKCSLILLWIQYNRLHHNLALALWKLCLLNVHFFLSSTSAALLLPAFLYARHALSSEFAQLLVTLSLVLNLLLPQGGHTLDVANTFRSQKWARLYSASSRQTRCTRCNGNPFCLRVP